MSSRFSRWTPAALLIIPVAFALLFPAQAQTTTPSGTEFWGTPIQHIVDALSGPIALGMVLIGFVGVMCFTECGRINGITRLMIVMLLCGSILLTARPFIKSLFAV